MESQTVNSEVSYVIEENISGGSINVINWLMNSTTFCIEA